MTNKEKLEALKVFLSENDLEYEENFKSKFCNVDLMVTKHNVAVHLSDKNDQMFFKQCRHFYHPFFIRDNESIEFIIEKMQNCIIERMQKQQRKLEGLQIAKENQKRHEVNMLKKPAEVKEVVDEKPKRKRVRIPVAERVTPIRK